MEDTVTAQRVRVTPSSGSRLEELLASYETARAQLDEAKARFAAVTDGIKEELTARQHAPAAFDIPAGKAWPALRLTWQTPWRFDTRAFKEQMPFLYARYSVRGGHWALRAVDGSEL